MECKFEGSTEIDGIFCEKNCCNQECCCDECGYEDCHEGCDIYNELGSCENCEFKEARQDLVTVN